MSTRIKSFFDNSIKNKLFKYLTVFSIIVICVLWLFQIVLLKPFYQANIVNNFKKSASGIETNLENEDLDLLMMQYSMDYDISLRLLSLEDASTDITSNNKSFNNYLRSLRDFDLYTLYLKAQEGKGSYSNVVEGDRMMIDNYNPNFFEGRVPEADRGNVDFIICAQILKGEDQDYLLIGYSQLTPVDPVTDTLKQQFLFVSMIFIGLSALFAVFMSKKISEPIIDINESAKTLATGNYDVKFKGEGYSEITELSNTLNYASEELKKVDGLQKELIAARTAMNGRIKAVSARLSKNTDIGKNISSKISELSDVETRWKWVKAFSGLPAMSEQKPLLLVETILPGQKLNLIIPASHH